MLKIKLFCPDFLVLAKKLGCASGQNIHRCLILCCFMILDLYYCSFEFCLSNDWMCVPDRDLVYGCMWRACRVSFFICHLLFLSFVLFHNLLFTIVRFLDLPLIAPPVPPISQNFHQSSPTPYWQMIPHVNCNTGLIITSNDSIHTLFDFITLEENFNDVIYLFLFVYKHETNAV